MTIKELETKWNSIGYYSGGYILISEEHPLSFHIGYYNNEQKSFVILNTGKVDGLISSKAITAECIEIENESVFRFILNYASLDEIFVKLCWDLMESSKNSQNPVIQVRDQYCKWMRLLQKASDVILSSSQQKGLMGELFYFKESLEQREATEVINAWVGPEASDQDYNFVDCWVEVKAVSIAATDVQISSVQQLARNDTGYLVVYFIDKTTDAGARSISVPNLVQQIKEIIPSDYLQDIFECKLAQYGYLMRDEEKYLSTNFRCTECRTYRIIENFPKLVHENIPVAIVNAKYRLDLLMLEEWKI